MSDYTVEGNSSLDVAPFLHSIARMDAALDRIEQKINRVDRALDKLGQKNVTAKLDVDIKSAEASILAVEKHLNSLSGKTVRVTTINSTVGSSSSGGNHNDIDTSRSVRALDQLGRAAQRENTQFNLMTTAIAVAIPMLGPLLAATVGVGVGALGALGTAVAGAGTFFIAAKSSAKELNSVLDAQKNVTKALASGDWNRIAAAYAQQDVAMKALGPTGRQTLTLLTQLKTEFANFGSSFKAQTFQIFNGGLQAANSLLKSAEPIAKAASIGIQAVVNNLNQRIDSGQFQGVFNYLRGSAGPIIEKLGNSILNFGQTFGNVIKAADPLTKMVVNGFENMSNSALKWSQSLGNNKGWNTFIQDAKQYGPQVFQTLKSIGSAVLDLSKALMPLGGTALSGLKVIADLIGKIASTNIGAIAVQLGAVGFALHNVTAPLGGMGAIGEKVGGIFSTVGSIFSDGLTRGAESAGSAIDKVSKSSEAASQSGDDASAAMDALSGTTDNVGDAADRARGHLGGLEEGAGKGAKAMAGLKAAGSGVVGLFGGGLNMAITAATVGFSIITDAMAKAQAQIQKRIDGMKDDIIQTKLSGAEYSEAGQRLISYTRNLSDLKDKADKATAAFNGNTKSLNGNRYANMAAGAQVSNTSKAYHQATNEYEQAQQKAQKYLDSLTPMARKQAEVDAAQEDLTEAIDKYGPASQQAAANSENLAKKQDILAKFQHEVAEATQSATDKMLEYVSAQVSATGAAIDLSNAQLAIKSAQQQVNDLAKAGKKGTDEYTSAENNLESAILNAANAAGKNTAAIAQTAGSTDTASASALGLYQELKRQADMAGGVLPGRMGTLYKSLDSVDNVSRILTGTVQGLGVTVQRIPGTKSIQIFAPTAAQEAAIKALGLHVTHLPNGNIYVSASVSDAERAIDYAARSRTVYLTAVASGISRLGYNYMVASGGYISGPGTATSDSIAARLSNGEYVLQASAVDKFGVKFLDMLNQGILMGIPRMGGIPAFASGGPVTIPSGAVRGHDGGFAMGDSGDHIGMILESGAVQVINQHPTDTGTSVNKELVRLATFGPFGG